MTTDHGGGMTREQWERTEVHKASTYSCSKCGKRFSCPDDVYDHLDAEHSFAHRCPRPRCRLEFRTHSDLEWHIHADHKPQSKKAA